MLLDHILPEGLFPFQRRRQDIDKAQEKDANVLSVAIGHLHQQIQLSCVPYEEVLADLRKKEEIESAKITQSGETAPTQSILLRVDNMGPQAFTLQCRTCMYFPVRSTGT